MATLTISYEGSYEADTDTAIDTTTGEVIDVSKMSSKKLVEKLQSGELELDFFNIKKGVDFGSTTYLAND